MNDKYIVFKREDWEDAVRAGELPEVEDAVVIRRQDIFAPPALDCYANSIQTAIEMLQATAMSGNVDGIAELRDIADYFAEQAAKSWSEQRKLPD